MVAPIVEAIRTTHGKPASGLGGGTLADADAAVVVLQAIRMAASPLDSIAAYDVACSPLGRLLGMPEPEPHQAPSLQVRDEFSSRLREELHREGAAALVDRWRRELERRQLLETREGIRLRQMVEFFEGLGRTSHEPEELVELARQARVDDPGSVGVVVMNIHQSKGLEFQGVVIADLDESLRGQTPQLASEQPRRPDDRLERVCTWYREEARPGDSKKAHADTITRTVRESLSMLYVAMTRACRDLVMQVRPVKLDSKGNETKGSQGSIAAVLRAAMGTGDDEAGNSGPRLAWDSGAPWTPKVPVGRERDSEVMPERFRPGLGLIEIERKGGSENRRRNFFSIFDSDATDRGTAIHACLALVGWLPDEMPSQEDFRAEIRASAPRRDDAWVALRLAELEGYLGRTEVAELLRKPSGSVHLGREYPIMGASDGFERRFLIDRLVIGLDDAGKPDFASIIDFKTDRIGAGDREVILQAHGRQLQGYRAAVMAKFGLPPERVEAVVVALEAGLVVSVPDSMPA